MTVVDPFVSVPLSALCDSEVPGDVPRDRHRRPLILQPDDTLEPYTRISTASGWLADGHGLGIWKTRHACLSLARHQDLAGMAAALEYGDKRLDEIIEQACERSVEMVEKRHHGTAVHSFTDLPAEHPTREFVPTRMAADVASYDHAMADAGLVLIESEIFVVNDALKVAGTVDGLYVDMATGLAIVGDKKGLPLDMPLPTPSGWVTMGDVQIGDQLFGTDGQPCTVLSKSRIHHKPCVEVSFDDGTSVICDQDHRWAVRSGPRGDLHQVITARELAKPTRSGYGHRVVVASPLELPDADLPISPWVLGIWLGDGKHTSGEVSKPDEFIFDEAEREGFPSDRSVTGTKSCPTRTLYGLSTLLRKQGLLGNKHIPSAYLRASFKQRLALLQGLLDTDGCWNSIRGHVVITLTDHALAEQVHELAISLGQRARIWDVKYSGFGMTGIAKTVSFTPVGIDPFRLPRKARLVPEVERSIERSRRRYVTSVVDVPMVATQCIEVDSPDSTYLCTRSMIPTHNTGTLKPLAVNAQLAMYHGGLRYDPLTGVRTPLSMRLDPAQALAIRIAKGQGATQLHRVDLVAAREVAKTALRVGRMRAREKSLVSAW